MSKKIAIPLALLIAILVYSFPPASIRWQPRKPGASKDFSAKTSAYVCPMHPEIMQDHPGKCPICGMDLVPAVKHDRDSTLHVEAASLQDLGVRIAKAHDGEISREILTYGTVAYDDARQYSFNSRFEGWVRTIHVHSVGEKIEQGEILYEIYSPDLIEREKRFLQFLQRRDQILQSVGDVSQQENEYVMNLLVEYSQQKEKFYNEDVDREAVKWLEDSRQIREVVGIVAERSGIVTQINASEGSFLSASSPVFKMADMSRIWINAVLYQDQAGRVKIGDRAEVKLASGDKARGSVSFISPISENNRVTARISLDNKGFRFRPGEFADVDIHSDSRKALLLPRSAVMHTGRGSRVMLFLGKGRFLPVEVETGMEDENDVQILDGLQEGAQVAANGQFLLDAASSLQDAAIRMQSNHAR